MSSDFAERWQQIEPLLDALFDLPAAQRADWLRRHCDDAALRALVGRLLDDAAGIDALERGIAQWLPALADDLPDDLPAAPLPTVAGYRVLRFVGAGGMASVFEAERALPGGPQTVALKLLRVDVHDPDERRRFLREQRILARLQHPRIAQLLDAGFTPAGTPFLALEFVAGDDLVTYCERRGLGVRERLGLFVDVCAAVEHAHRNLIVHRDLKPSNVLVGAGGNVKLVDFGIAKLLGGEGDDTRTAARRLTRSYAAPEQLAGDAATTAVDVYALGVLLARLLHGPREAGDSVRADTRSATSPGGFDETALRRRLGVDLHAVVGMATQYDPARRYAAVAALRDDVERYLAGKPLHARADTLTYRMLTFARRHVWAVAAGAAFAATLAGATLVSLHESSRAQRAARDAGAEARRADALKAFLEGLFDSASPGTKTSESAEVLLALGRERAERDFAAQPALRAEILALVGDLERRSGYPDRAQAPLEEAAALAAAQFGAADRRTLHVETLMARNADELGRVDEATARLRKAVAAFEAGSDRDAPEAVPALAWLASFDERSGRSALAIDIGEEALALARRVLPDDSDACTEAVMNLGWILMDAGHADRAEPLLREAVARKRARFGARHAEVADAMEYLTFALVRLGRYGEGERLMREALDIDAGVYARPHTHMAWHLNELANVLALEGKLAEADGDYAKSIATDRALGSGSALNEAVSLGHRARIRFRQGDYAQAEAGFRDVIERKQRLLGADYGNNGRSLDQASLAETLIARGHLDEARLLVEDALAEARRRHGDAHPDTAYALTVQAQLCMARGDRPCAVARAADAVAMYGALADPRSDEAIRAQLLYGEILQSESRDREAEPQFERALSAAEGIEPSDAALVARAAAGLAHVDAALGDEATARRYRAVADASLAAMPPERRAERAAATRLVAQAPPRARP